MILFWRVTIFGEIGVIDKLSSIIESLLGKGDNQPVVPIADKLLLSRSAGAVFYIICFLANICKRRHSQNFTCW
ncbi:hypothetical protein [Nostoc sp.]|uniref:hypothetical protein n=1 Tax=Nostoc sp. TaxID=1180 RepID=UPI002FF68B3D